MSPSPSAVESALVLTEQEWEDLADIADQYLYTTRWVEADALKSNPNRYPPSQIQELRQRRTLCERIVKAASS